MELTHDHPLRTIHHKSPLLRHQRKFTHVNPLLDRRTIIIQNEGHIEGGRIGYSFAQTLDRAIFGLPELVMTKV